MKIIDVISKLEDWAPLSLAESYDNSGLIVGNPQNAIARILINLDMTEAVLDEAIQMQANLVIAHHPIWFSSRKNLIGNDYVSRTILKAIRHNISLYAFHTNLDMIETGVNHMIASKLDLKKLKLLLPKDDKAGIGQGMIGSFSFPMDKNSFFQYIKKVFNIKVIRYADASNIEEVKRVAVCGGSGSFLTASAIANKADAFITADITYHKFFDNEGKILLLDIGHYESEQYTSNLIEKFLLNHFPELSIQVSNIITNPVCYI